MIPVIGIIGLVAACVVIGPSTVILIISTVKRFRRLHNQPPTRQAGENMTIPTSSNSGTEGPPPSYEEAQRQLTTQREAIRERAKNKYGIDVNQINICIAGRTGCGKSSLINAIRGLPDNDPRAAQTAYVECTLTLVRYDFPEIGGTTKRINIWDAAGCGTANVPAASYFEEFCLGVFDHLVLVIDSRMTEQDIEIVKQANAWNITLSIIRSNSDKAINDHLYHESGIEDGRATLQQKKEVSARVRDKIKEYVANELLKSGINNHPDVYVVSSRNRLSLHVLKSALIDGAQQVLRNVRLDEALQSRDNVLLDELYFIRDILIIITENRY